MRFIFKGWILIKQLAHGELSFTYDKNSRKLNETTHYGPFNLTHHYSYDKAGNKNSYTAPDNAKAVYHWQKNRLFRIEVPGSGSLNYSQYTWNQPAQINYHGGGSREIQYDPLMRPTRILAKDPAKNPLLDYQYSYDKSGNITQRKTDKGDHDYQYDALQRLTEAKSPTETEGWEYDPNGNRTKDNLTPGSWSYDENDRLNQSPTTRYQYDQAGNATQKTEGTKTTKSHYNAENRLTRIETESGQLIAQTTYDPMGRRIKKETATETRYFHYSDEGLVGEYTATGTPIQQYGYEPDSTWTTNPLYTKTAEGVAYYQNDHLGTPQLLVLRNGAKVWEGGIRRLGGGGC